MNEPTQQKARKLTVDVVSDVMCPWCYIGEKNLKEAISGFDGEVEVFWRPYQLDPTLPAEGKDRKTYLNEKFGGEARASEIYQRIEEAGQKAGIDFRFEKIALSPNTLNAHRLIRWAGGQSREVQANLVECLFEVFFIEGGNIGDIDVLVEIAAENGMDGELVRKLLQTDRDMKEVEAEINQARQMGIGGVPCFIIDNKFALVGAQPADSLREAFEQAGNR